MYFPGKISKFVAKNSHKVGYTQLLKVHWKTINSVKFLSNVSPGCFWNDVNVSNVMAY